MRRLLGGLGTYPDYFLRLREVNRRGPTVYGDHRPSLRGLSPAELLREVTGGAELVDVRLIDAFAAGHIPGALSIALRDAFASWLGWLVPAERPLVFVLDAGQDRDELIRQCLKVGYERLVGELAGGMEAWRASGRRVARTELRAGPRALAAPLLDVRQADEFTRGHVPGAVHVELGSVRIQAEYLATVAAAVMCGHGERAMSAASLLERAGGQVSVFLGGPEDWARGTRESLESGA